MSKPGHAHRPAQKSGFYHELEQVGQELEGLQNERRGLLEILDRLRVDEQGLELFAIDLERQCTALESELEEDNRRSAQMDGEMSELEKQASSIRAETAAATRRLHVVMKELMSLENAIHENLDELSTARRSLDGARDRVTRMDYMLRYSSEIDVRRVTRPGFR